MATGNGSLFRDKKPPTKAVLEIPTRRHALEGDGPYLVIYGSVTAGFMFTGPFALANEAVDFAEMYLSAYHWEIATLQSPEEVK